MFTDALTELLPADPLGTPAENVDLELQHMTQQQ